MGMNRLLVISATLLLTMVCNNVTAACLGMAVHAHRGAPTKPENSRSSVELALNGSWDGVELDLQQMADREWVLHHDFKTERTVVTGAGRVVSELNTSLWRMTVMRDRDGHVTQENAPFLSELYPLSHQHPGKIFNLEIKQPARGNCDSVRKLVNQLQDGFGHGDFFITSIDRQNLSCVRSAQPNMYLGIILLDTQSAVESKSTNPWVQSITPATKITAKNLEDIKAQLGNNVGLHVDIRTIQNNPNLLKDAQASATPIFIYSMSGDRKLIDVLGFYLKKNKILPSGVIIDGNPESFCSALKAKL